MHTCEIITDDTLRETNPHGTPDFPFQYYYDDIKKIDKQYIEWHWHNEFEFVFVETGPIDCLIGQERICMGKGDGMFINGGIIHRFESVGEGQMPNILFAPAFIAGTHTFIYDKYISPVLLSGRSYIVLRQDTGWQRSILETFQKVYKTAQSHEMMREIEIHTLVCSMWSEMFFHIKDSLVPAEAGKDILLHSRLQLMLQFIHEKYPDKITLTDISDSASISKSEALRCFHTGIQTTPVNYLISYRLNRAKDLLATTKNTVTDISLSVGFDQTGYFIRTFKKAFGMTPKTFRKEHLI